MVWFPCRYHGCGWFHPEDPATEPIGPIVIPAGGGPDDLTAAITEASRKSADAMRARIETAVRDHYATVHGLEVGE